MSNENKIRILYVQPGKYPEERFVSNELHPLQQLVGSKNIKYFMETWHSSQRRSISHS